MGPRIEITVDDQGSGLPPEHRSVLEPSEGIERGLVRSCTTSPDGGVRFVLTLPNALVGRTGRSSCPPWVSNPEPTD